MGGPRRRPGTAVPGRVIVEAEAGFGRGLRGAREDLAHDGALRVGVLLRVPPLAPGELALDPRIELTVCGVPGGVSGEGEHPLALVPPRREGVQVPLGDEP